MKKIKLDIKIGAYIRSMRKEKGLTENDLAKLINLSQQQISRYEKGITPISISKILLIINALNLSIDDFIEKVIRPEQDNLYIHMIEDLKKNGAIKMEFKK